jgi:heme exporter protein A
MRLEAKDLSIERSGRIIFTRISFVLDPGQCLIVTGDNGAGKSTLLRVLAGLLPLTSGGLFFAGQEVKKPLEQAHYIGHQDGLRGMLSLQENLNFWASLLAGDSLDPRSLQSPAGSCEDVLAFLGLSHAADLPAAYLSAGQKRRAALAKLLVAPRPLWLLDEPLTALDAKSQKLIKELMQGHVDHGGMVVTATHAALGLQGQELRLGLRSGALAPAS